jgi:hypothetical protein
MWSATFTSMGEATFVRDLPTFHRDLWDPVGLIVSPQLVQVEKMYQSTRNDLNFELDEIIRIYGVIPRIKNLKYKVTSIDISTGKYGSEDPFLAKNILLTMDPNDTRLITYKDVMALCDKHGIEFENQSFGTFIKQVRKKFENRESVRKKKTPEERAAIYEKCGGKCMGCKKSIQIKGMHIDHIVPLASGG